MSDSKHYNDYGTWIRSMFPFRVQKISINAGFSCPNRDGRIGQGGCIYCDNRTFNPSYCNSTSSIKAQLEEGKKFFSHKYPDMKFLAYFQAYTNTYESIDKLKRMYEEALSVEDVIGIVIGTRPDCVSDELLDYLGHLNTQTFITIEYGIETAEMEEVFYEDESYIYIFSSMKSDYIVVIYEAGWQENVKDALTSGRATIEDLDRFGISYYKVSKRFIYMQ